MLHFLRIFLFLCFSLNAFEQADRTAIYDAIQVYADAWNYHGGKGFGDSFTEDADFVNIFGMNFIGRNEIEERHLKIIQTLFKGSFLEIQDVKLREAQPGLVIALVSWKLEGFRNPGSDMSKPGVTRDGIFTQVFINRDKKWLITASQNTLKPTNL